MSKPVYNQVYMGRNVVNTMLNDYEALGYTVPTAGLGLAKAWTLNRMMQAGHSVRDHDFQSAVSTAGRPVYYITKGFDTVVIIHEDDMDEFDDMLEAFEQE